MERMAGNNCPWLVCCCGTCSRKARALRIREDGIEWSPAEWAANRY